MYAIGVDIGGTNLPVGIVDMEKGVLVKKKSTPFVKGMSCEDAMEALKTMAFELLEELNIPMSEVEFAGMGVPGVLIPDKGYLVRANNLGWEDEYIASILRKKLGCPVYIDNDANAAAWGEYLEGACKDSRNAVMLTLGTGLGGGVILNGKLLWGSFYNGGELGHTILIADGEPCSCGNKGCVEQYTSASALVRWGNEILDRNGSLMLSKFAHENGGKCTAKAVIDCAKAGDPACVEVFRNYVHYLALECVSLVNFLDPEIIAIGGGVSAAGDFLLDALREEYESLIVNKSNKHGAIKLAELGNDAGIIGAALLGKMYNEA